MLSGVAVTVGCVAVCHTLFVAVVSLGEEEIVVVLEGEVCGVLSTVLFGVLMDCVVLMVVVGTLEWYTTILFIPVSSGGPMESHVLSSRLIL